MKNDSIASSNQVVRRLIWQILPVSAILSISATLPADNSRDVSNLRTSCIVREDRYDGSFANCADRGLAGRLRRLLLHPDLRRSVRRTGLQHLLLLVAAADRLERLLQ
jgi:hypothetical protein